MKKLKDINWNHLYAFYEIARCLSLKDAAKHMGVTSSTISEQLKKLEKDLGKTLILRGPKGIQFTKDGEQVFALSKHIFEAGSKLLDHISVEEIGGYTVNIGIEDSLAENICNEFISQYWDLYSPFGVVNTISIADPGHLVKSLIGGQVDWGVSLREINRGTLKSEVIGKFEILFCCSSELYQKFIDPKDILRNIPMAQGRHASSLQAQILKHLRLEGCAPKEFISSDHPGLISKLTSRGRCVTYIAKNPLEMKVGLKTFEIGGPLSFDLYAVYRKADSGLISIKKLKELVQTQLSQVPIHYHNIDLQIEISDVSQELLRP